MSRLEEIKKVHIDEGFYKGTPIEVMTMEDVQALETIAKFRICYKNWVEGFEAYDVSLEEYTQMTTNEFNEAKISGDYGYDEDYELEDFLNDLTYSYVNEIFGTPLSLV